MYFVSFKQFLLLAMGMKGATSNNWCIWCLIHKKDRLGVNKHFFADGDRLKLVGTPGTSASFSSNAVVAAEGLNVC